MLRAAVSSLFSGAVTNICVEQGCVTCTLMRVDPLLARGTAHRERQKESPAQLHS